MVATGRKPVTEGLGLENTDIKLDERGAIKVDDYLRTTAENVWAIGDVKGGPQFTYISLDDFRIIFDQLYGKGEEKLVIESQFLIVSSLHQHYLELV